MYMHSQQRQQTVSQACMNNVKEYLRQKHLNVHLFGTVSQRIREIKIQQKHLMYQICGM